MPLILAIEPDRRQAARITALGRGTLQAELVVADSTEHGIAALHGRTPDLILTSLLLSPKDEAALRELDNGGVPVPTLMIPMLASSSSSSEGRGGLRARLRWSKPAVSNDGCDPHVFAGQIEEYLSRVQEAREVHEIREAHRNREGHDLREVPTVRAVPAVADAPPAPEFETAFVDSPTDASSLELHALDAPEEPWAAAVVSDVVAVPDVVAGPEAAVAMSDVVATSDVVAMPEAVGVPEFVHVAEVYGEPLAAPEDASITESPATVANEALSDSEVRAVEENDAIVHGLEAAQEPDANEREVEVAVEGWDELALESDEGDATIELSNESVDLQAFVEELKATYADLYPQAQAAAAEPTREAVRTPEVARVRPIREAFVVPHVVNAQQPSEALPVPEIHAPPSKTLVTVAHELPVRVSWPSLEGMAAEDAPPMEMTEVVADFVAALDDCDSEPDNFGQGDPDSDLWMPLSAPPGAFWPRLESTCSRAGKPLQDEWGFFDPEQCGVSALVAKLDQMSK